jgi:hypothetical protein
MVEVAIFEFGQGFNTTTIDGGPKGQSEAIFRQSVHSGAGQSLSEGTKHSTNPSKSLAPIAVKIMNSKSAHLSDYELIITHRGWGESLDRLVALVTKA